MKILLPTAKERSFAGPSQEMLALSPESQLVLAAMTALDLKGLEQLYGLSLDKVEQEAAYLQALKAGTALAYPAWQLFDGLMYRQMKRENLTDTQQSYVRQHLFITSAFYGIINALDAISPHRLDFLMGLKVQGQSLKQHWRPSFEEGLADDELVISLLSSEFETVFTQKTQQRMIKLVFMEEKAGQLKVHSTISKKARGQFVNALIADQVRELETIKSLQVAGFAYRQDLSEDRRLVFVKPV